MRTQHRILLAEDLEPLRNLVVELCSLIGCECDAFETGAGAVEAFRSQRYDLVLLDCRMPDVNGYDAARRIREIEAGEGLGRTPIVAVSSNPDEERALEVGIDECKPKPTAVSDLRELLERYAS